MTAVTGTPVLYGLFLESLASGLVNFEGDAFNVMLCDPSYTPNQNTHKFKADVTHELGATYSGYAAGGTSLPIGSVTYSGASKKLTVVASNILWPSVIFPSPGARYAVIYNTISRVSGGDSSRPLVAYVDFGTAQIFGDATSGGQAFYLNWPASGLLSLSVP